jgi:hypothetical protein
MSRAIRQHLRSNIVGYIALFFALSTGSAVALSGTNTVDSGDIIDNQVYSADVRNDTLSGGGLAAADLRPSSVGGSEVKAGAVTPGKLGGFPAVHATTTASVPTANGSGLTVPLDNELYDTANMHSTTTNNHILKAPIAGIYLATANVLWTFNDTGPRILGIDKVNSSGTFIRDVAEARQLANGDTGQSASGIVDLAAGEGVRMTVIQSSGGALYLVHNAGTDTYPDLVLTFLHP